MASSQPSVRPYPFRRLSSPLTYSVLDSADSLNDSASETKLGHFSTFGHFPVGRQQPEHLDADAEDESDIEFDYSPQITPNKRRRRANAGAGLSVVPLATATAAAAASTDAEKQTPTKWESVRDSGMYSHSPSHNEEEAAGETAFPIPSQLLRAYPPLSTFGKSPPKDYGGGTADGLIISPSAVSVRVSDQSHVLSAALPYNDKEMPFSSKLELEISTESQVIQDDYQSEQPEKEKPKQQKPKYGSESLRQHRYESSVFSFQCYDIVTRDSVMRLFKSSRIGHPTGFRLIGRVTKMKAGNIHEIELHKPPSGTCGFYIRKGSESEGIYVSKFSNGYPEKFYSGLLGVGDKILAVNGVKLKRKTLDEVFDLMKSTDNLILTVQPSLLRPQW
eukprot:m.1904 g.1904  ORF g.1904 m.1904 type:complete len:390 (+) comp8024_c0_seq1:131-1300(+)